MTRCASCGGEHGDPALRPAYWPAVLFLAVAAGLAIGLALATIAAERNRELHRWDSFELAPGDTAQGGN
jgi:hypothetical protein